MIDVTGHVTGHAAKVERLEISVLVVGMEKSPQENPQYDNNDDRNSDVVVTSSFSSSQIYLMGVRLTRENGWKKSCTTNLGWLKPYNGMFSTYQLTQDFATIHSQNSNQLCQA